MRRTLIKGFCASLLSASALAQRGRDAAAPPVAVELGFAVPLGDVLGRSDAETRARVADFARLGARWLRTDFWWDRIQPYPRRDYDFAKFDLIVAAARQHGMRILAELHGIPPWVAAAGSMASAANRLAYLHYARATARHFRHRIQHWEIWNEPNLSGPWGSRPDVAAYTSLLRDTYAVLKGESQDAFVVSGGLSPAPETADDHIGAADFLTGMYAHGAKGHFDALGFHPYSWPLTLRDAVAWNGWEIMERRIRQIMATHGDAATPIWMTEFGAPTAGGKRAVSPRLQAEILQQAVDRIGELPWAGPLFWYSYRDRGGRHDDTENWFGLLGPAGERKPAYDVFRGAAGARVPPVQPKRP